MCGRRITSTSHVRPGDQDVVEEVVGCNLSVAILGWKKTRVSLKVREGSIDVCCVCCGRAHRKPYMMDGKSHSTPTFPPSSSFFPIFSFSQSQSRFPFPFPFPIPLDHPPTCDLSLPFSCSWSACAPSSSLSLTRCPTVHPAPSQSRLGTLTPSTSSGSSAPVSSLGHSLSSVRRGLSPRGRPRQPILLRESPPILLLLSRFAHPC